MSIFIIVIQENYHLQFTTSPLSIMAGEKNILVTTSIQMYTRMHVTIFTIFKISPPCIIVGGRCMQVTIFTIFSIFKISPPCIIVGGRRMQVTPDSGWHTLSPPAAAVSQTRSPNSKIPQSVNRSPKTYPKPLPLSKKPPLHIMKVKECQNLCCPSQAWSWNFRNVSYEIAKNRSQFSAHCAVLNSFS